MSLDYFDAAKNAIKSAEIVCYAERAVSG